MLRINGNLTPRELIKPSVQTNITPEEPGTSGAGNGDGGKTEDGAGNGSGGLTLANIPSSALLANLAPLGGFKSPEYKFLGFSTVEEARKSMSQVSNENFDKFFEVVKRDDGRYVVEAKEPYTSFNRDDLMNKETGEKITSYRLSGSDGIAVITVVSSKPNGGSVEYYDKNGNPIDRDGSINTGVVNTKEFVEKYGTKLHERGKGWSGSFAKMQEKATQVLNDSKLKEQLKSQYKALVLSTGGTYDEKMFEQYYKQAINSTLGADGMITGRGARGLSKKGHAYCDVNKLLNTFLAKFDEITKVKK